MLVLPGFSYMLINFIFLNISQFIFNFTRFTADCRVIKLDLMFLVSFLSFFSNHIVNMNHSHKETDSLETRAVVI